ncbi:hypothetical protein MRB53_041049 [Persea americana]|nr:hypothetical protein MRB53_041049 [Persea americana]
MSQRSTSTQAVQRQRQSASTSSTDPISTEPAPLSGASGTPNTARARKEVIISGGSYNTVQLLKLSGIGPKSELQSFGIDVVKEAPGLGNNMQDRYEIPVNAVHPNDFPILDGCTFDAKPHDKCFTQWQNNPSVLGLRGAYGSDGLAAAMAVNSDYADNSDIDLFIFGGPVNFTGYFPRWGDAAVASHKVFSWYTLKAHTRNTAGTVELRSTDPPRHACHQLQLLRHRHHHQQRRRQRRQSPRPSNQNVPRSNQRYYNYPPRPAPTGPSNALEPT